jgi:hypothetical protein
MPVFDFPHRGKDGGSLLKDNGPLIQVEVGLPEALQADFVRKGIALVPPRAGYALIDTGASLSSVHEPVLQAFRIPPIDRISTQTPHGAGKSMVYPAKISFPGLSIRDLPMDRVVGCDLKWEASDGEEIIMLLGRDLLQGFLLVYNGKRSHITLAY